MLINLTIIIEITILESRLGIISFIERTKSINPVCAPVTVITRYSGILQDFRQPVTWIGKLQKKANDRYCVNRFLFFSVFDSEILLDGYAFD